MSSISVMKHTFAVCEVSSPFSLMCNVHVSHLFHVVHLYLNASNYFLQPEQDSSSVGEASAAVFPLMDAERALGLLIGLHSSHQAQSLPLSPPEVDTQQWLTSQLFSGGLQLGRRPPLTPDQEEHKQMAEIHSDSEQDKPKNGDKEKSHARTTNPPADATKPFLQGLAEGRLQDPNVKAFLDICERYCRSRHFVLPIEFPPRTQWKSQ